MTTVAELVWWTPLNMERAGLIAERDMGAMCDAIHFDWPTCGLASDAPDIYRLESSPVRCETAAKTRGRQAAGP